MTADGAPGEQDEKHLPRARREADMRALLAPSVIAVVGASRDPAKWSRRALEHSQRAGFSGRLYGVSKATEDLRLPGVTTVPDLAAIAEPVDLAVIARPAAAVPEVIASCASTGVRAALVIAAGFGELGEAGLTAERQVLDLAGAAGLRVLGPNTFGLFVARDGINLTPREHIPAGSVALLSQSGNVAVALYEQARQAGIGFSACVGVGNQIDVGFADLLTYFAGDDQTTAVAMYAEGLRGSGAGFRDGLEACRAAGKPVVILKAGRSAQSARAVATHTGALATDDRVWQSVLDEGGATRVDSVPDMIDALTMLTAVAKRRGRVMVLTDGGGDSVLTVDALAAAGVDLAIPREVTRSRLDELVPPDAPRTDWRNPVTLDTAGGVEDDPMLLARCAELAAKDDGVDVIAIAGLFGGYPRQLKAELACAAELVAIRDRGVPVVVQSAFATAGSDPVELLRRSGVPVLADVSRLARALAAAIARPGQDAPVQNAPRLVPAPKPAAGPPLPAEQVAALLQSHGIVLPPIRVAATDADLAAIATVADYPACVKINDPAVSHKSDVGGVRLGLTDAGQLMSAGRDLWKLFPESPLLVMPSLPSGPELLIGTGHDPVFGPYVLIGRGGIWAETDPDLVIRLAPASKDTAEGALRSLRYAPILFGGRGTPPVDLGALAGLIAHMSELGAARPDLIVELNPVIAYPDGYAIADLRAASSPRR